jgi:hypothetical protein
VLDGAMPSFKDASKKAGATKATLLLQIPVIDYSKRSESMDRWYVLFDPSLVETQRFGFQGEANGASEYDIFIR